MDGVNFSNVNKINAVPLRKVQNNTVSNPQETVEKPAFKAQGYTPAVIIRTNLTTKDERKKYNEIAEELDLNYRKNWNLR